MFSNIFLVLCVFRTGLHGAQPIKTFVSNWKTMFCSLAEEMRSLFLVRTRMCCCVVQAAANWPWFALSHLLLTNDWNFDTLIGMKRLGGGRSCNKCGPRIERLRQSGTYTVSVTFGGMCTVHFAFEVSLVLLLFAVVTIGKLISMYVCYFCLTFCQSEISWLRHTRASIARVSVGEPQCVGVPPKAHWVDMTKNAKKWNNQR